MKKYVVRIQETLQRYVIIEAEDKLEAEEIGENLCNSGEIDLVYDDFFERSVKTVREATDHDEADIRRCSRID